MIRVYLLPVQTFDGTEQVIGIDIIHDALLFGTEDADVRKLIMDTTQEEHDALRSVATDTWDATLKEIAQYNAQVIIEPPDPTILRAAELLTTSPGVITQPEMWELMRIFARRLGYDF